MNRILAAVSVLKAETDADPIEQLFDVAKAFRKPLTPPAQMQGPDEGVEFTSDEPWDVSLADCAADPTHQRPLDRDKVEAMRRDRTWEREPILVNFTPDDEATYYILDGQHRAEAARQAGVKSIKAIVKIIPTQDEHEHIGVMAKTAVEKADSRIPAGDPRRGRIHPGEWTKENNPATLAAAEEKAHSLPEKLVIQHRQKQLRKHVAVPGLLSPEEEGHQKERVKEHTEALTTAGIKEHLEGQKEGHVRTARSHVLGYGWEDRIQRQHASNVPAVKAAYKKVAKAQEAEEAARRERAAARNAYQDLVYTLTSKLGMPGYQSPEGHPKLTKTDAKKLAAVTERQSKTHQKVLDAELVARRMNDEARRLYSHHAQNTPKSKYRVTREESQAINAYVKEAQRSARASHVSLHREQLEHAKAQLARHERAKGEAVKRTQSARKEKVSFVRQQLGQAFAADLKKHVGHIRAVFLDDTPAHDGILYAEYDRKRKLTTVKRAKWVNINAATNAAAMKLPKKLDREESTAVLEELREVQRHLTRVGLTPAGSKPTKQEITAWVVKHCPNLVEHGKATGAVSTLVNHLYQTRPVAANVQEYARGRADFHAFAEMPTKAEKQVMEALYGIGAKAEDHEVPELIGSYRSWADHKMDNGKRLAVSLRGGRRITYVPHKTLITGEKDTIVHTATMKLSPQKVRALHTAIERDYAKRARSVGQLEVVDKDSLYRGEVRLKRETTYDPVRPAKVADLKKAGWTKIGTKWLSPRDNADMLRDKGVVNELAKKRKPFSVQFDSEYMTRASREALDRIRDYNSQATYVWDPDKGAHVYKPPKGQSAPAPKTQAAAANYQRFVKALDAQLKKSGLSLAAKEVLRRNFGALHDAWEHTSEAVEGKAVEEAHKAPRSERGMLRFEGFKPTEAVQMMTKLGLASGMTESVPYDLVYGDRGHRRGRVTPMHRDYTTGEHPIPVPPNDQMILHGVTARGRGGLTALIDRFAETGGPKSISERRRQQIDASGLSVKGDMGSGIDQYLFSKIGQRNSYGGGLVLGLRHTALARRDVLLSPTDYGGGHDRHGKYSGYMNRIGAKIHGDVPHAARAEHLERGLGSLNEWNLKHEVPWEEVHTIFVEGTKEQFQAVQRRVRAHQRKGTIPKHVKVAMKTPENVAAASRDAAMEL